MTFSCNKCHWIHCDPIPSRCRNCHADLLAMLQVVFSSATFSPCRKYRYELWRRWDKSGTVCAFIGLNPSTADETKDDPTVRRCIRYAKRWGHGSLVMLNIFAWRDTDPAGMMAAEDPVGPGNDEALIRCAKMAAVVVAAWGNHGAHRNRAADVIRMIPYLSCLGRNKNGSPVHPLYQPSDALPVAFP